MCVCFVAAGDINSPYSSVVPQSVRLYHWQWHVAQWYQECVPTATMVMWMCPTLHYTHNACLV